MMTKILLNFALCLLSVSIFSVPLPADEPLPNFAYSLTGVKVEAIERTKTDEGKVADKVSDKLTYWIRFDVVPSYDKKPNDRFLIEDPIDQQETEMTFDKPIEYQGELVPAGTNLLTYKKFDGKGFNINVPGLSPGGRRSATIKSGFEIPADDYIVTFQWTTKSGKKVSAKVEVHIDVKLPPGKRKKRKPQTA